MSIARDPGEVETPSETKAAEQRSGPRRRVLKSAQIVYNSGHSLLDCIIEDLSLTGARIRLPTVITLPDIVVVRFQDGRTCPAKTVWRRSDRIGIRFTESGKTAEQAAIKAGCSRSCWSSA